MPCITSIPGMGSCLADSGRSGQEDGLAFPIPVAADRSTLGDHSQSSITALRNPSVGTSCSSTAELLFETLSLAPLEPKSNLGSGVFDLQIPTRRGGTVLPQSSVKRSVINGPLSIRTQANGGSLNRPGTCAR